MEPRPRYGYGKHGRPLETELDRDGEEIREILRKAGFAEFSDEHAVDGFAVNSNQEIISVAAVIDDDQAAWLTRYAEAIRKHDDWDIVQDLDDERTLAVWRRRTP